MWAQPRSWVARGADGHLAVTLFCPSGLARIFGFSGRKRVDILGHLGEQIAMAILPLLEKNRLIRVRLVSVPALRHLNTEKQWQWTKMPKARAARRSR